MRMQEQSNDKYVPKFKESHTSTGGRVYGIRHVPQSSMFEITGEGAGDLPAGLKGRFTSTGRAERSLKTYLQSQKLLLEALEAKQARADDPQDILKTVETTEAAEKVEKPEKPTSKTPVTAKTGS